MALKANVSKAEFDALPDGIKEHYKEDGDSGYWLEAEGVEDVSGLKSALTKERENVSQLKQSLGKFKDVDPAKYQELLQAAEEDEKKKLASRGKWEALEKQLIEKHNGELKGRDERLGSLSKEIERLLIEAEGTSAIAAAKGSPVLLMPHLKARTKVFEEDGKFVAKVIDDKGNPRIGDAQGTPMTFAQLVEEMKSSEQFGRAFEASGAGGSGAPGGGGAAGRNGSKTVSRQQWFEMSPSQRTEHSKAGGQVTD